MVEERRLAREESEFEELEFYGPSDKQLEETDNDYFDTDEFYALQQCTVITMQDEVRGSGVLYDDLQELAGDMNCDYTRPLFFVRCPTQPKGAVDGRKFLKDGAHTIAEWIHRHCGTMLCVKAAMASGKTTMLPVALVNYFKEKGTKVKVVMLLPYIFLLMSFLEYFDREWPELGVHGFWGAKMGGRQPGNRGNKADSNIVGLSIGLLFQWVNTGRQRTEDIQDAMLRVLLGFAPDNDCRVILVVDEAQDLQPEFLPMFDILRSAMDRDVGQQRFNVLYVSAHLTPAMVKFNASTEYDVPEFTYGATKTAPWYCTALNTGHYKGEMTGVNAERTTGALVAALRIGSTAAMVGEGKDAQPLSNAQPAAADVAAGAAASPQPDHRQAADPPPAPSSTAVRFV